MTLTFKTLSESSIRMGLPTDWKALMCAQLVKPIKQTGTSHCFSGEIEAKRNLFFILMRFSTIMRTIFTESGLKTLSIKTGNVLLGTFDV